MCQDSEGRCPSGAAERNVNPRAETLIFLFLVTHKCSERSVRGEGERERDRDWTEGDSERGTHGQRCWGWQEGKRRTESYRHKENKRNQTRDKIEVRL